MGNVISKKIRSMGRGAKIGLVLTLTLALGIFIHTMSESAPTANGRIVYSINTTIPQTRTYTAGSPGTFASAAATSGTAAQTWMVEKACPKRTEHIAGYIDGSGNLYIMRWNGTAWSNEWNVAVGTNTGRRFDIVYLNDAAGTAMVAYAVNGGQKQFAYRTWNGTSWSTASTITTAQGANVVNYVRLAANPTAGSSGCAIAVGDTSTTLTAMIWSGTAWGNEPTSPITAALNSVAAAGDTEAFDVAYENTTGKVIVAYGTTAGLYYAYFNGTSTWTTLNTTITTAWTPVAVNLETDASTGSNSILLATNRKGSTSSYGTVWSGTVWSTVTATGTLSATPAAGKRTTKGMWLVSGATKAGIIVYQGATAGTLYYSYTTNSGTSWTTGQTWTMGGTPGAMQWIDIDGDPQSADTMMVTFSDANSDLWAKQLVINSTPTFTWGNADASAALTTTLASITTQNFSFAYNRVPVPTVTSTSPNSLPQGAANQTVTITGTNFLSGATVSFNDANITTGTVTVVNSTTITVPVTIAAATTTGAKNVSVTTSNGTGTGTGVFTVTAAPTVTSTSPTSMTQATGPTTITINGTGFESGATVAFSGTGITLGAVSYVSATQLTVPVTVAANATTGAINVTVTNPDSSTGTGVFTVNAAPAPTVTSTSPNSAQQGTSNLNVTITGTNFLSGATASFNDANITVNSTTYVSATQLTANITIAAATTTGAKNVTVTLPGGQTGTGTGVFTVNTGTCVRNAPSVTFAPASGSETANSSLAYTLTITNNDTAFCTGSTFALSITSETGTAANFILPSALGATSTGALAPAGTYSTTLTVKSQSAATIGATDSTTMNAADSTNHASLTGTGSVTTTIASAYVDSKRLHNANRFGTCSVAAYSGTSQAACVAAGGTWTPTTKWSGTWGTPNGKYGAFICATCHMANAPDVKRIEGTITAPFGIWSSNGAASVSIAFQSMTSMGHDNRVPNTSSTNVCEVCHSRNKYHNYNATRNALFGGNLTHNNGVDCTGCHPHAVGFKASESGGNSDCSSCHNDIYGQVNGSTTTYHHYMQNAAVTTLASGSKYPNVATLTTTDTNRRCLMCHVDHDVFRPDLNGANGGARGKNLRTDATVVASTTAGFTRKDFDNGLTNGGICTSCHLNQQTKNTANQKSDGTTVTPVVTKANFAVSMHNYSTNTNVFGDGSQMNANCSKCHDAQNGEASPKTNIGTHDNTARRLLGALGGTGTDAYEEQFCYRCHSVTADPIPGTKKAANGKDWYGVASMTSASENIFQAISSSTHVNRHNISKYNGLHRPAPTDETLAYIAANKHVECADCHDPHAAGQTKHAAKTNAVSAVLKSVPGVDVTTWPTTNWTAPATTAYNTTQTAAMPDATKEYQICFKCHSGANTSLATWNANWTDLALDFNPNNGSAHPVVTNSNAFGNPWAYATPNHALSTTQLTSTWSSVGTQTMYCSDCHGNDAAAPAAQGPHGSAKQYILAGPNIYWPTQANGTPYALNGQPLTGLFCLNCHPMTSSALTATATRTFYNNAHTEHDGPQSTGNNVQCTGCHLLVPHGGKQSRLIANRTNMPTRYAYQGSLTNVYLNGFTKTTATGYTTGNCKVSTNPTGLTCNTHSGSATTESW